MFRIAQFKWLLLPLLALTAAAYARIYLQLPKAPAAVPPEVPAFEWQAVDAPAAADWSVFRRSGGPVRSGGGELSKRFRLAGTFFMFSDSPAPADANCRAILDDLRSQTQILVAEGEQIEDVQVARILHDHVVLRCQGREEELWLSFADPSSGATTAAGSPPSAARPDLPALEESRFGKRVGENRWVFNREALVKYYNELRDDPERIVAVYDSMKPDYANGAIAGYTVDVVGEKDFFDAVGLQQRDKVRRVNSMQMSSKARAEYLMGEFMKNRMSAVVMDIEREGKPSKLIYLIR